MGWLRDTAISALACLLAWLLLVTWSPAQTITIPYGQPNHDPNAPGHWYPANCCSQRDCEPLPIDAVSEVGAGMYEVHYLSERFGRIDEVIAPDKIRDSQDGGFHGCWHINRNQKPRTICFFVPVNS